MKKKIIQCIVCVSVVANAFSQTEKFDIATFIPPQGWQRNEANGTVSFMNTKTANGLTSFCQIILYPSSNSTGNASKDFTTAWQNLVVVPTKSNAKPTTQTEKTPDGWTVVTGAANVSFQGMNYNSIVATITGFGKTMNVQVNLAGNDYASIIEKFFNDLELDSKTTASNNPTNKTSTSDQKNMISSITLNDYEFIPPQGWHVQKKQNHMQIQNPQSGCLIQITEPQLSSGDMEKDAKDIMNTMYQGWQFKRKGEEQYVLSKGFLPKGLEYFMMEAGMSKLSADGSRYDGYEDGAALIVKVGPQVVIIAVRHSDMLAHNDCRNKYDTWRRFFNSFTVKNATAPKNQENVQQRIIGSWSMSESRAIGEYVFAANGNYAFYGAIGTSSTSRDYNYEYLHIKTYAFQGDGSYSIAGNQLTLKKRNRDPEQIRFRFEKVNHGGTDWKDRIWMLTKDSYGEVEVPYDKKDN